jgi:outer membrane protein OmpA-like peptidoglycan-associated protein
MGEATNQPYFDRLKSSWKNNKPISILVLAVVIGIGGLETYSRFDDLVAKLSGKEQKIAFFNKNTPPIYFEGRDSIIPTGQLQALEQIAKEIKTIGPATVIVRSHTSRVDPTSNVGLTRSRGDLTRRALISFGVKPESIKVVPLGGKDLNGLDKGYEQRVEIELSDVR